MTLIGKLRCQYQLQVAVLRQLGHCFLRDSGGLRPLLGIAIGVNHGLVSAGGILIAQRQHLAEGFYRRGGVAHGAVNAAQPLQKYGAVVTLAGGVVAIGLLRLLQQLLQDLSGLIVATLNFVDYSAVVRHLEGILNHRFRFGQAIEGFVELAVPAVNLRHLQVGLRILGVGVCNQLVLR